MSKKYYAVAEGRQKGVFLTWVETEKSVKGHPGAKYKSFKTLNEANEYLYPPTSELSLTSEESSVPELLTSVEIDNPIRASNGEYNPRSELTVPLEITTRMILSGLTIYTDGSCTGSTPENRVAGYAFIIPQGVSDPVIRYGKVQLNPCTNQIAELYAIYEALKYTKEHGLRDVNIFTDSMYSINCLTQWVYNWKRNGWMSSKGEPVKNSTLIKNIIEVSKDVKVKYFHVTAHNGDKYNEMADKYANEGRFSS